MEQQNVNTVYELIADLTNQMLMAAKMQDWDLLLELESSCTEQVEKLKSLKQESPPSRDNQDHKLASIKRILADDRQIRDLVSPRMAKLNSLISATQNGKKLTRAYKQ
jgi:flagellar protein FliT